MPAGGESGADGERPDSWLVRKHRYCGEFWCKPTARSGAFTITSTCSRYLGLPTLAALLTGALVLVGVWRTWDFPAVVHVLIAGVLVPFLALFIFTALPLPCAVFAWKAAGGEAATAGECFSWCRRRAGRLLGVLIRLGLLWLGSLLLLRPPAPLGLAEDLPRRRSSPSLRTSAGSSAAAGESSAKTLACP